MMGAVALQNVDYIISKNQDEELYRYTHTPAECFTQLY